MNTSLGEEGVVGPVIPHPSRAAPRRQSSSGAATRSRGSAAPGSWVTPDILGQSQVNIQDSCVKPAERRLPGRYGRRDPTDGSPP